MWTSIASFFSSNGFMPHGMCLLWRPGILWSHVVADTVIALAYFSIPAALVYFARHRRDFPLNWVLYLFGAFIVCCGLTHVGSIVTFWVPIYGAEAAMKIVTAGVSMVTAVMLWPLMPKVLRIPSIGELERTVTERTAALKEEIERRRSSEAQLRAATDAAEAANTAKTVFLAGMSHELRSPLNAVLGFAQMLEQIYPHGLDERQREYLRNIQTSGGHLLDLIERLLDLSTIESGALDVRVDSTDVAVSLHKARAVLEPMAQQFNVTLSVDAAGPEGVLALADPTRLAQIIVNIGANGIKYNRPGGRVDISVLRDTGGGVVIRFSDTGLGIPAGMHQQVFQPFNRLHKVHPQVPGAGIGLALSKRLAQAMGAELTFESSEGEGTIFDLTLREA